MMFNQRVLRLARKFYEEWFAVEMELSIEAINALSNCATYGDFQRLLDDEVLSLGEFDALDSAMIEYTQRLENLHR